MSSLLSRDTARTKLSRRPVPSQPTPDQVRTLLGIALRPTLVGLVLIATCVLVTLVAANSDLTGTSGAIAASWLALHQVQLTIGGASLGVLPLLPTLLMIWAVARGCARAVTESSPRHERWWVLGAAVAGPLVATAISLAVVADASSVIALSPPNALAAFAWVLAVHLVGAVVGIGTRVWRPVAVQWRLPRWVLDAARPALRAGVMLLATGAAITVVSLLASWSTVGELLQAGEGITGALGLTVVSILYLPNIVIGSTAVLVGSATHVGAASVSMFDVVGGPVPALPVLGVLPAEQGSGWAVGLVIPAVLGAFLGRDCARRAGSVREAVQSALVGAAAVAVVFAALGFAAGGNLGTFGTVGVNVATFAGLTFGWLAVFGAVTAALVRWRRGPRVEQAVVRPEPVAQPTRSATAGMLVLPARIRDEQADGDEVDAVETPVSSGAVIEAEVLEDVVVDSPVGTAVERFDAGAESVVVDAEVVDSDEVAQVTTHEVESDLPDGPRAGSD
ncbi:hypothetical protein FK531_05260 [Rhodococcus spelaei]|uniref:Uncharacterized protein n=1 Tax=Rhodococcus spelaei TaxID=2546320 RepID=A0A541BP07_9NOCA|nr:DUF6350 family protein [Rhodococcus spelaei]TQF74065.1 hypothetical protein FK531_05260 [Rhodococcus spelaei]